MGVLRRFQKVEVPVRWDDLAELLSPSGSLRLSFPVASDLLRTSSKASVRQKSNLVPPGLPWASRLQPGMRGPH